MRNSLCLGMVSGDYWVIMQTTWRSHLNYFQISEFVILNYSLTCLSQPCEKKVSEISLTRLFDLICFWLLWLLSHLLTQSRKTGMYNYLLNANVDQLAIESC